MGCLISLLCLAFFTSNPLLAIGLIIAIIVYKNSKSKKGNESGVKEEKTFFPKHIYNPFYKTQSYKESSYYKSTQKSYYEVKNNIGSYGEYLIYEKLAFLENEGSKFLFNAYLPIYEDKYTEMDVCMINKAGIFVFESKNYSGWIFGSESQRHWYQTLPKGRRGINKESFFNPVMQNRTHMNAIKKIVGTNIPMYSIIVFSDRCIFKNIDVTAKDTHIIHRYDLKNTILNICNNTTYSLSENDINELYQKLVSYTNVSESIKQQHIDNIHNITNTNNQ